MQKLHQKHALVAEFGASSMACGIVIVMSGVINTHNRFKHKLDTALDYLKDDTKQVCLCVPSVAHAVQ